MNEVKTLQCYFIDKKDIRCKLFAPDEFGGDLDCWCSPEHRKAWREANQVKVEKEYRKPLTIPEMQEKMLEIGARMGDKQRKLNI